MENYCKGVAAAAVLSMAVAAPASAAPISAFVSNQYTEAQLGLAKADAATWFASVNATAIAFEDFEGQRFTDGQTGMSFNTNVGTFKGVTAGQSTGLNGLAVLTQATRPSAFDGRFNVTDGGSRWLDSNDYKVVDWDVKTSGSLPFTHIGFFMTDVNDVNAKLKLLETGEEFELDLDMPLLTPGTGGSNENGRVFFVGLTIPTEVTLLGLRFTQATSNDGWGIDDITIARVPEPATLGLLGAGLFAVGVMARRRKA